jgi:D-3-phosphoglycerate dehydrogenase / 2-oxoglutarate reductase
MLSEFADAQINQLAQHDFELLASQYDAFLVRLQTRITADLIYKCPSLKAIVSPTTGLDHIDLVAAESQKVKIISLKGEFDFLKGITSTAEHTWGILLSLVRNVPSAFSDVKEYRWRRDIHRGNEIKGKNLCIVGLGRLGSIVAEYGIAFGMKVFYYDPYVSSTNYQIKKVRTLDELLMKADVLTIHVPLEKDTIGLIGKREIGLLPPSSYLINTARALIVDEESLLDGLECKQLAGAAVDVLENEFKIERKSHRMIEYAARNTNLLVTPHIGGATFEAVEKTDIFVLEKFKIWQANHRNKVCVE